MSASTKVAGVHACHLTIGDQKTEGWALNRTRHRLHSLRALGYGQQRHERARRRRGVACQFQRLTGGDGDEIQSLGPAPATSWHARIGANVE